jgi:hypothetical protein
MIGNSTKSLTLSRDDRAAIRACWSDQMNLVRRVLIGEQRQMQEVSSVNEHRARNALELFY